VAHIHNLSYLAGRDWEDAVQIQPEQKFVRLHSINKNWVWWCMPFIPTTEGASIGGHGPTSPGKNIWDLLSKSKKDWGTAQVVVILPSVQGPDFKPQYHPKLNISFYYNYKDIYCFIYKWKLSIQWPTELPNLSYYHLFLIFTAFLLGMLPLSIKQLPNLHSLFSLVKHLHRYHHHHHSHSSLPDNHHLLLFSFSSPHRLHWGPHKHANCVLYTIKFQTLRSLVETRGSTHVFWVKCNKCKILLYKILRVWFRDLEWWCSVSYQTGR
jgi:hypothetical protein